MTSLYYDIRDDQWPVVYDEKYNVSLLGLEKFHIFDAKKWRNIVQYLKDADFITEECLVKPNVATKEDLLNVHTRRYLNSLKYLKDADFITEECLVKPNVATKEDLLNVHTRRYLNSLKWSPRVAIITEVPIVACVPNFLVQCAYLKPMRLQTGGTVLAGKLALQRGWAINIGGGFHHCSGDRGGGFCPYADITLCIKMLQMHGLVNNVMIVDLDAHQGNGYQRDFMGVPEVYIMDMYNRYIYPNDKHAKQAIRRRVELSHKVEDTEYIHKLKFNLKAALKEFQPDILVYNAGTDVLDSDPLGHMKISEEGIVARDEFVFQICRQQNIPIVMVTSGGYLRKTAKIIADSIMNLHKKGLIKGTP